MSEGDEGAAGSFGRWPLAVCVVVLGVLAFHGSRGLYEPDEGRYATAALSMLECGSWWVPKLHGHVYLDKPPLLYWSVAAGFRLVGVNEWGARLANGVALIACSLLVGRMAQQTWGGRAGPYAAAMYSVTLLPAVAASALTPDGLLCLFVVLAYSAYLEIPRTPGASRRFGMSLLLGAAVGLGVLTKGPAMVLFAAPIGIHAAMTARPRDLARRTDLLLAGAVAVALGSLWYIYLGLRVPGALEYAFDNQIAGRLWREGYDRNSRWWHGLTLYVPLLTLGMLPTSLSWLSLTELSSSGLSLSGPSLSGLSLSWASPAGWMRHAGSGLRSFAEALRRGDALSLLGLWITIPLPVLFLASSKLPLYLLPLAPPLVVATAKTWARPRWTAPVSIAVTLLVWIVLKALVPALPLAQDARAVSRSLETAGVPQDTRILAVAHKQHGLPFYGYRNVEWLVGENDYPYFDVPKRLADALPEEVQRCISDDEPLVFISRSDLDEILRTWGLDCRTIPSHTEKSRMRMCRCDPTGTAAAE